MEKEKSTQTDIRKKFNIKRKRLKTSVLLENDRLHSHVTPPPPKKKTPTEFLKLLRKSAQYIFKAFPTL